jgi:hypothetical protein
MFLTDSVGPIGFSPMSGALEQRTQAKSSSKIDYFHPDDYPGDAPEPVVRRLAAKTERPHDLDEHERIRDRRVVARQHDKGVQKHRAAYGWPWRRTNSAASGRGRAAQARLCQGARFC